MKNEFDYDTNKNEIFDSRLSDHKGNKFRIIIMDHKSHEISKNMWGIFANHESDV